jgi:hypothetical protein
MGQKSNLLCNSNARRKQDISLYWVYINLRKKFKNHHRKIEFEFLNRIGYQINISWIVLPDGISEKEGQAVQMCYIRAFEPKLNDDQNSIATVQAEELKKQFENWEQWRYEYLKKQIENWEQSGEDKDTIIKKIWEVCKEPFDDKHLILPHTNLKKLVFEIGTVSVGRGGTAKRGPPPPGRDTRS